jgi:predicted lipid-binding transport protein (Tim44 family)
MSIIKIHTAKIISVVDVNDCITVVVGLESSQIHYKKDKNNNVISGSMDKVISIKEEWSFVQKKSVNTPQWLICEIKTISNE